MLHLDKVTSDSGSHSKAVERVESMHLSLQSFIAQALLVPETVLISASLRMPHSACRYSIASRLVAIFLSWLVLPPTGLPVSYEPLQSRRETHIMNWPLSSALPMDPRRSSAGNRQCLRSPFELRSAARSAQPLRWQGHQMISSPCQTVRSELAE